MGKVGRFLKLPFISVSSPHVRRLFPITTALVGVLGLLWGFTGLNSIWFLLVPFVAFMLVIDTRTTGILLITLGTLWFPTFQLEGIPLKPDHIFALIGAAAIVFWLLRDLPQKIHVPLIALVPLALLLLQITPGWGEVWDLFSAWGRTLSLVALALAVDRSNAESRRVDLRLVYFVLFFPGVSPVLQALQILPISPMEIPDGLRFGGLLGHPTFAGYTITLLIALLCFRLWRPIPTGRVKLFLRVAVLMLLVVSVILTGAIGPFVLSAATLVYWVVVGIASSFSSGPKVSGRIARFIPAFVALGGLLAGALASRSTLRNRLSDEVFTWSGLSGRSEEVWVEELVLPFKSLTWREMLWREIVVDLSPYNWLGNGAKSSEFPHSGYLQTYMEYGWLGVLVALCVVMVVLVIGIRRFTSNPSILILLFILVAGSFADPVWFHPTMLVVLIAGSSLSSVNGFEVQIPFRKNLRD